MSDDIESSLEILERIQADESIPKNIRRAASEAGEILEEDPDDAVVKISKALNKLEDVISDPNIPVHARTQIWNVASQLESATSGE